MGVKVSTVRATCGVQLKDKKRANNLMVMLSLNETIDQLAVANCAHWCGDVQRRDRVVTS